MKIIAGHQGIRVAPIQRSTARTDVFEFMSNVSVEQPKSAMIREMAREFKRTRDGKGKILVVAGPAVVHTGGAEHLEGLIQCGYVDLLFARLEERRVGKECRILGGLGHYEKKKL